MDPDRLKWITRPATLDRWEVRIVYLSHGPQRVAEATFTGWCNRKRNRLWTHTEVGNPESGDYQLHDLMMHVTLVCEQDKPVNQQQFERAMIGQHWEQPELPF